MAGLQIFNGLAPPVTDVLRLFIDGDNKPVPANRAAQASGRPKVSFVGKASNWQRGKNCGTIGRFAPVGTTNPFTPGPSQV